MPGWGGVAFDHYRATGGQCADGICADDADGEGEVRRAKDDDWAQRLHDATDVGLRQRQAVWECGVNARLSPGALADQLGKELALADGTSRARR